MGGEREGNEVIGGGANEEEQLWINSQIKEHEEIVIEGEERRGVVEIQPRGGGSGVYVEGHAGATVGVGAGAEVTLQGGNGVAAHLHAEMINGGVLVGEEAGGRAGLAVGQLR